MDLLYDIREVEAHPDAEKLPDIVELNILEVIEKHFEKYSCENVAHLRGENQLLKDDLHDCRHSLKRLASDYSIISKAYKDAKSP